MPTLPLATPLAQLYCGLAAAALPLWQGRPLMALQQPLFHQPHCLASPAAAHAQQRQATAAPWLRLVVLQRGRAAALQGDSPAPPRHCRRTAAAGPPVMQKTAACNTASQNCSQAQCTASNSCTDCSLRRTAVWDATAWHAEYQAGHWIHTLLESAQRSSVRFCLAPHLDLCRLQAESPLLTGALKPGCCAAATADGARGRSKSGC
jgi:hypothetical protein